VHESLIPPNELPNGSPDPASEQCKTEFDVNKALIRLGHKVKITGAYDDLAPIRKSIEEWQPDIVFNLLEEFAGNPAFDYYVVSYLEMMNIPYTGCNPRGLLLARDKALSKILLSHHHIKVPDFTVFPKKNIIRKNKRCRYPMIVKSLLEEGSVGISQASLVNKDEQLRQRVKHIHSITHGGAIAEQYIEGRELYVTVLGNTRLKVLPFREIVFNGPENGIIRVATHKVKWDKRFRERWDVQYKFAENIPDLLCKRIVQTCKRAFRILNLNGYARFDLRIQNDDIYMLEANPNPGIDESEDSTLSAQKSGLDYDMFIQKIINLGLGTPSR
jgi:D-alanine-D-alanine ligase